ncbi:nuclear mitotic apparatus protein 1 isoform X4 [Drosophila albomicans]|uniref:Nuclear mitotic apparatus protein 1 isoform X4 n=1 Tax=Drosophila albomicans TaxID=7291 RepID=A0A6P8YP43_DROAB|nr:nuclear mitotic apparatus protein 1 isoform X4 [Drosophila albomicans]
MNLYTIYDWITSLLRTRSGSAFYKAIEAPEQAEEEDPEAATTAITAGLAARRCSAQHVEVEFIPTLDFVFQKAPPAAATTASTSDEQSQHVAAETSATCDDNVDTSNDDDDNASTHTYIISRSSFTAITTSGSGTISSSTPYAVTSTDTAELLRQQNQLSLTEDEQTISSFSIEPPTSSMTIDMAEPQQTRTTATTTTTTTRSEATSSGDVLAANTTTTTTTTSSSIEEDIEEAIDLSEVEEELLQSNIESLSGAAKPSQQSAKVDESSEEAEQFRIDDAQLSGGQLAQHFLVDDDESDELDVEPKEHTVHSEEHEEQLGDEEEQEDEEDEDEDDDDFDISLPLEQRKVVHSRHEDNLELPAGEADASLSNQSTTDDVSDFGDEPQHATATETEEQLASESVVQTANSQEPEEQSKLEQSELEQQEQSGLEPEQQPSEAQLEPDQSELDAHSEQDHSLEEIMATNESVEITYDPEDPAVSSSMRSTSPNIGMVTDLDVVEEEQVKTLQLPQLKRPQIIERKHATMLETLQLQPEQPLELTILEMDEDDEDAAEECSLQLMKLRLMAMHQQTLAESAGKTSPTESANSNENPTSGELKQMERVALPEFSKDVLEDITEESERQLSLSTVEEPQSLSMEESKTLLAGKPGSSSSVVSLNMLKQLEAKVHDLYTQLETKDSCLNSLNLQLEAARRESNTGGSVSARDSSSLVTNSTEYRTFQDEFGAPTLDIYVELSRRDEIIAKLTESLQHSLNVRGQLQTDAERLGGEVQTLRKQLHEAIDTVKRTSGAWHDPDHVQRISEISMDLISESDDDFDRNYLNDHEERASRSSRERQLSVPRQSTSVEDLGVQPLAPEWPAAFSKQIEQFQKCLLPGEMRPFLMVQRKFDDFLSQQLLQCREQSEKEHKLSQDRWESEKLLSEQTQQAAHTKEMEELRKYFEHRCADLEKQFSDDVFSHKSQHLGGDSSSECSEVEQLPEEVASKEPSPRKRKRAELLLSPSHRQLTPSGVESLETAKDSKDHSREVADLKVFYQTHIHELKRANEDQVRKLTDRLRFYERRQADDDYLSTTPKSPLTCPANKEEAPPTPAQNPNASLIIIDEDELNLNNESQVIQRIIEEYERRLQEQLALARQDIATELEQQIQNLLSESPVDDHNWPKELILLREKFTAKSQLEITQLNIKHAEEMSRMKLEYEKQLSRKTKRHLTFDSGRDLENIINERDGLRELSKSFRSVLCRLAKCVANCEDDLNATLSEEVQRILAQSRNQEGGEDLEQTLSSSLLQGSFNATKQLRLVPDVHSLLEVVEDPSLVQFIDNKSPDDNNDDFDLGDCLERLKSEAAYLLQLSEDLDKHANESGDPLDEPEKQEHEVCCEAENGLKTTAPLPAAQQQLLHKLMRTNSLNDQHLGVAHQRKTAQGVLPSKPLCSLPIDLQQNSGNASELSFQLVELKNRLIKSETDRQKLQQQLTHTIDRNAELGEELQALRDQLSQLNSLNHTDYAEGYGLGDMNIHQSQDQTSASFAQLQERARHLLTSPTKQSAQDPGNATVALLQMIEDFCREGDKVVESGKKDRKDLQSQYAQLESHLREVNQQLSESNAKRDKFEVELKASIDKIFVLREIISDLETQVQTKALNEQVMEEKSKQLEDYVKLQMRSQDALQQEVHSLKTDIGEGYKSRIRQLEEKLQQGMPSAEQSIVLNQVAEQLRDIETTLDQKTKTLESLHNSNTASNSCSLSATEDVSVHGGSKQPTASHTAEGSPSCLHSLTVEGVQRVAEKLDKHTRVEEAAIKRIRDLEMQVTQMRTGCVELQHERDSLQGRIDEQTQRISALNKRLEEQRQRAEELHRVGTSDLNTRVHELQCELRDLNEQLTARDKQMATMQQQLQRSKEEIARLESDLAQRSQPDRSHIERLEADVQLKNNELQKLREKMRTEMVNRLSLPDLMDTMLADKNDEIDHLQQQLAARERELQAVKEMSQVSSPAGGRQDASTKHSARTLSDIGSITEFPEPEVDRRAAVHSLNAPLQLPEDEGGFLHQTMDTSKEAVANLTYKRTDDLSGFVVARPVNTFEHPHYFQDPNALGLTAQSSSGLTPELVPRQINFSNLTEDSKLKTPGLMMQTPDMPKAVASPELQQLRQKLNALEREKQQQKSELERNLEQLQAELAREKEQLQRHQKLLRDHEESEEKYQLRIDSLESKLLESVAQEAAERDNLRREINCISAAHAQCEQRHLDTTAARKREVETLNAEIKAKTERNKELAARLQATQLRSEELQQQVNALERELERLKNSEHSSKQYSVDEIAQQVEKELNYSAQLDSNILRAIESEEENNLDKKLHQKEVQTDAETSPNNGNGHGTDDENFTGERELLNQLEAVRAQLLVERDQTDKLSKELLGEKQHSQEIQEQDVLIIEAMRKRLEAVLDAEDELHKQLDMERERCERLQTQLTAIQRAESRRNSLMLKSPTESPRKSPRADFESELCDRLRSELKLLTAQNERERERSADAQRNSERERQRYEKELQERVAYCERLKQEMEKLARDKESAELELEHFNERLTLQANEIQSLETRMVTLQETETRRATTRSRQHQEQAKLQAEIHELKSKLIAAETTRESLEQKINQLRFDVTRSAQRESKLSEALANANDRLAHSTEDTVPVQFMQKMKEINTLLEENTQENRQMAETMQYLVGERIALQKKCEELSAGNNNGGNAHVTELEERCRQLLGRYLRVESHRKALVYQKRYLKLTLEGYQASEQLALQQLAGGTKLATPPRLTKKKLFKTVALAIIAIQRIKYIGRIWHTGKRIVSKSVFTITQQRTGPGPNLNVPTSPLPVANQNLNMPTNPNLAGRLSYAPPSPSLVPAVNFSTLQPIVLAHDYSLQTPALLNNNHINSQSNKHNNNNSNHNNIITNNNNNEHALPSLASLDWSTAQKAPKRVQSRHH